MVRDRAGLRHRGPRRSLDGLGITLSDLPPEQVEADLVVVGPEEPLVDGLADRLRARGRMVFGPGADGARLEGSKAFMKRRPRRGAACRPPAYGVFDEDMKDEALAFLRTLDAPWVVKTDGLAAGKGVLVTDNRFEAEDDVAAKLSGRSFGEAGRTGGHRGGARRPGVLAHGGHATAPGSSRSLPLRTSSASRTATQGPNTGGMGAYSPVPRRSTTVW